MGKVVKMPSAALIALQRAKTALEGDSRRNMSPQVMSVYHLISELISEMEMWEGVSSGWRDGPIYGEGRTVVRLMMTEPDPREEPTAADFQCWGDAARDPLTAMRAAVMAYLQSAAGQTYLLSLGRARFNWGDAVCQIPEAVWVKHGLQPIESAHVHTVTVEHDEPLRASLFAK